MAPHKSASIREICVSIWKQEPSTAGGQAYQLRIRQLTIKDLSPDIRVLLPEEVACTAKRSKTEEVEVQY